VGGGGGGARGGARRRNGIQEPDAGSEGSEETAIR